MIFASLLLFVAVSAFFALELIFASECSIKIKILGIIIVVLLLMPVFPATLEKNSEKTTEEYDVYQMNAPNGIYYTDIDGDFVLGCGDVNSSLGEAYTIKYWKDGELHTVVYSALDMEWRDNSISYHVHVLGGNEPRYYLIEGTEQNYYGWEQCVSMDIYIIFPFEEVTV